MTITSKQTVSLDTVGRLTDLVHTLDFHYKLVGKTFFNPVINQMLFA